MKKGNPQPTRKTPAKAGAVSPLTAPSPRKGSTPAPARSPRISREKKPAATPAPAARRAWDDLPRVLSLGIKIVGPDYTGCVNSGMQPVLWRSRTLDSQKQFPKSDTGYRYVVGPYLYVEDAVSAHIRGKCKSLWTHPQFKGSRWTVRLFKTAKGAKEEYLRICRSLIEANEKDRNHIAALRATIADMSLTPEAREAARLELGDYL